MPSQFCILFLTIRCCASFLYFNKGVNTDKHPQYPFLSLRACQIVFPLETLYTSVKSISNTHQHPTMLLLHNMTALVAISPTLPDLVRLWRSRASTRVMPYIKPMPWTNARLAPCRYNELLDNCGRPPVADEHITNLAEISPSNNEVTQRNAVRLPCCT
jgi:hypothetical protein